MGLPCLGNIRQDRQIDGRRERQIVFLRPASQATLYPALITTVAAIFPGFFPAGGLAVRFRQKADDFVAPESAITPRGDTICPDCSVVAPAPQGIRMDMK